VSFLTCTPTAEGALTYRCQIAASCQASPCDPAQWTPIEGEPSLPAGFFEPGGTRGSAIQVTPVAIEGSVYTLVNKDVGAERWAIIRDDSTGIVTGNVFTGSASGDAQFHLLRRPDRERGRGRLRRLLRGLGLRRRWLRSDGLAGDRRHRPDRRRRSSRRRAAADPVSR
jgi:hypothetical protein